VEEEGQLAGRGAFGLRRVVRQDDPGLGQSLAGDHDIGQEGRGGQRGEQSQREDSGRKAGAVGETHARILSQPGCRSQCLPADPQKALKAPQFLTWEGRSGIFTLPKTALSSRGQDGWFSAIKPGFESP
jgi:hypothetical protein